MLNTISKPRAKQVPVLLTSNDRFDIKRKKYGLGSATREQKAQVFVRSGKILVDELKSTPEALRILVKELPRAGVIAFAKDILATV